MLTCDTYHTPHSLAEALELWSKAPEGSRIVAGATDILPWARDGRAGDVHVPELIDVTRISELDGYTVQNGRVRLGAGTVYQDFLTEQTLMRYLPCMPYCSIWFADDQIRAQASLTGNLVNASPAADGTPAVVALNGEIELARLDGEDIVRRLIPVVDFIRGPGQTQLTKDEIATAVVLDTAQGYGGSFQKVGLRRSLVISVACAAGLVKADHDGRLFEDVRLAVGGVGPRPIRLLEVEQSLKGERISHDLIEQVAQAATDTVGSRSRQEYRREVIVNFVRAAIEDALTNQPNVNISFEDAREEHYA
ncbi:MAG: FAD binding domain-containing protein [Aestuariivita sp.]|nr:FAD binding domain-containing protein [Aestuariivita sp.]MCY4201259.1 FAD binding domain-containing protein [Aestuariivita sp.]MCY4288373.1 FAD binding domain-containing protein [Aestuariivita sp.]MCY4346381.1 FAD binding domain-containing protein [Aestuariivita sp.]